MANYVVHVRTPRSPADAFAYMADLSNFAEWDPGIERVDQVRGDGPGPGAVYDVTVKGIAGSFTLQYELTHYESPTKVVATARSRTLTSLDSITIRRADAGSLVTYDAVLNLNGPMGVFDPLLGLGFKRIGDRAAGGLVRALDGERVADPEP